MQQLKTLRNQRSLKILAVVPTLPDDLCEDTIPSIQNQTISVTKILHVTDRVVDNRFHAKMSQVLNKALANVRLEDYDYLLRVDGDVVLPPDFLELNLRGKPDVVGVGYAHLIRVEPFLELMDGKFFAEHDDSYINLLFSMHNKKVLKYAVDPIIKRPVNSAHTYRYSLNWGKLDYCEGYLPPHVFEQLLKRKNVKRRLFYLVGFFLALLRNTGLFEVASYIRQQQIKTLRRYLRVHHGIRCLIRKREVVDWMRGPRVLQLGTNELCNLSCVYCNTEYFRCGAIGQLSLIVAEQVLNATTHTVKQVHLFLNNEPLLEPRLPKFTALSKQCNPTACTVIYTNGSIYQHRHMLVDAYLDEVHFTISAASATTYLLVHGKPLFDEAVRTYNWFLQHKLPHQKVFVHFVRVAENKHELEAWKQMFKHAYHIVSPLHTGYKQQSSLECASKIDNVESIRLSTLKGKMASNLPCTVWDNMAISSTGLVLQCCGAPYSLNYGAVDNVLEAWQQRLSNKMLNPACRTCNLKRREWKFILQTYIKN